MPHVQRLRVVPGAQEEGEAPPAQPPARQSARPASQAASSWSARHPCCAHASRPESASRSQRALSQVFNEINTRNMEEWNVWTGLVQNRIFMGVLGFTAIIQTLIVEFAGVFAQTTPLTWQMWLTSIIIGLCCMPISAAVKFMPVPAEPNLMVRATRSHPWSPRSPR